MSPEDFTPMTFEVVWQPSDEEIENILTEWSGQHG